MKSPAPSRPQKMAFIPACIFLCFAALSVQAEETPVTPQPPDILLGPLFNDVQNAKLFPDQKTFADAVPNSDPLMILADYRMQQNQSGFDLRHFVNVNFTLPKEGEKYVPPEGQSLREHIDGLWPVLTRSTEIPKNGILCYRCRNLMSCRADVFARYITGTVTSPC
ncbi:periplasmic trehalase [Escherichia coli]|nr:periplasmic trehalase [Escherichia coli]